MRSISELDKYERSNVLAAAKSTEFSTDIHYINLKKIQKIKFCET
jgi:hypothetical protein